MDTKCAQPIIIRNGDRGRLVRCRQCPPCLRASQRYWAAAAADQIRQAGSAGCRSWIGTCTFKPEQRSALQARAEAASGAAAKDWNSLGSAERFGFLQQEALRDTQRFWKRLRKAGLSFKYLAVFEGDDAGRPHMHCLVHETDAARKILKRELDNAWGLGFTDFRLLPPEPDTRLLYSAISYVTKGIITHPQGRVCASTDYSPERRPRQSDGPEQRRFPFE